jgi:NAD-dependent DNA ligase
MNNLKQFLDEASRHYYVGSPIIPDDVFDRLASSINYAQVGFKEVDNEEKHLFPMYSQQKYYVDEGAKPLSDYKSEEVTYSPKFDGASLALSYVLGNFVRAMTRGDGITGKVVTDLIRARPDLIPFKIPQLEPTQINCEVVSPKSTENSRNYAAGALNLKNIEEFKTKAITILAHEIQPAPTDEYETDMKTLERWKFTTVRGKNLTDIYPTDGIVFRVNNNKKFYEAGYTSKHPRGAYALKERGESVETTLLDVIWQVGKSGKVTPVAILEPVYIGDALVSRATLNNKAFIEALDLQIGNRVGVIRSGEIIPTITHRIDG